jgi:hypothetical protein
MKRELLEASNESEETKLEEKSADESAAELS